MIEPADMAAFFAYRKDLFATIARALHLDGHCKSYEGSLNIALPTYFEDGMELAEAPRYVEIELGCYVLGPSRSYRWRGVTLGEAVKKARESLVEWKRELEERSR